MDSISPRTVWIVECLVPSVGREYAPAIALVRRNPVRLTASVVARSFLAGQNRNPGVASSAHALINCSC